jgi:hypothetical protein
MSLRWPAFATAGFQHNREFYRSLVDWSDAKISIAIAPPFFEIATQKRLIRD